MVTGGSPNTAGDSTELLVHGAAQWTRSGSLPSSRKGLRGASINNKVIVTGDLGRKIFVVHIMSSMQED